MVSTTACYASDNEREAVLIHLVRQIELPE